MFLLFFDEITHASMSVQKSAFQIILDKMVGQHPLPKSTLVIAAGNRPEDRSGAQPMPAALNNRFARHTELEPDIADFSSWWVSKDKDPRVLSYIRSTKKVETLHCMPENISSEPAFPTPRSWDFAAEALNLVSPELRMETMKGIIGPGQASALCAHLEMELPDVDLLLKEPWKFVRPAKQGVIYALVGAFVQAVTEDTMDAFMEIAGKMTKEGAMLMTRDLFEFRPELATSHNGFNTWVVENKLLVL